MASCAHRPEPGTPGTSPHGEAHARDPSTHHVGIKVADLERVYMIDPDGIRFELIQTSRSLGQLSQGEASAGSWPAAG